MKKILLLLIFLVILRFINAQTIQFIENHPDPFCQMVKTMFAINEFSFNSVLNVKNVFEHDTLSSFASVHVKKSGNHISFLLITPGEGEEELLYVNDTAWVVDHLAEKLQGIGTGIEALEHNKISKFVSFTVLKMDTMITQVQPFWKVVEESTDYSIVSLDITNKQKDLSAPRVEFTCGNSDNLLYKELQEAIYMNVDTYFQELVFSDYRFQFAANVFPPEYFTIYDRDLSLFTNSSQLAEQVNANPPRDIYLENLDLFDLSGNPFLMPEEGLLLFDLWYVGCAPCMKSAPIIEKLYFDYKGKVFFFGVNEIDQDTTRINAFREKMGITYPVLLGNQEELASRITGATGYPVFFLVDAESGKVLWSMTGYSENLEEIISQAIKENL